MLSRVSEFVSIRNLQNAKWLLSEKGPEEMSCRTGNKIAMRANDIRSCGRNGNLSGALKVFEKLGSHADTTLVLNSMLDACVECRDISKTVT